MFRYLGPNRNFFTNDESSFHFCPKTGNVLAYRGDKNVYEFYRGLAKASITAVLTFSASGMCPSMLRYPYTRIPAEITRRFSDDWGVRCSPSGWMTPEVLCVNTGIFSLHILENVMPSSLLSFLFMDSIPI